MKKRLIDANALWELMRTYDDYQGAKEAHDLELIHRDSILFAIENAPTIDAVPVVHGEWKPHPIKGCEEWDLCSACGIGTHRRLVSDLGEEEYSYSYCPWCGAKMDGEQ